MTYQDKGLVSSGSISASEARALAELPRDALLARAVRLRDEGHGRRISYSQRHAI